jgi:hypothetical protein
VTVELINFVLSSVLDKSLKDGRRLNCRGPGEFWGLLGEVKQQVCCFSLFLSYINNSDIVKVKLIIFCEDGDDSADFHETGHPAIFAQGGSGDGS